MSENNVSEFPKIKFYKANKGEYLKRISIFLPKGKFQFSKKLLETYSKNIFNKLDKFYELKDPNIYKNILNETEIYRLLIVDLFSNFESNFQNLILNIDKKKNEKILKDISSEFHKRERFLFKKLKKYQKIKLETLKPWNYKDKEKDKKNAKSVFSISFDNIFEKDDFFGYIKKLNLKNYSNQFLEDHNFDPWKNIKEKNINKKIDDMVEEFREFRNIISHQSEYDKNKNLKINKESDKNLILLAFLFIIFLLSIELKANLMMNDSKQKENLEIEFTDLNISQEFLINSDENMFLIFSKIFTQE